MSAGEPAAAPGAVVAEMSRTADLHGLTLASCSSNLEDYGAVLRAPR